MLLANIIASITALISNVVKLSPCHSHCLAAFQGATAEPLQSWHFLAMTFSVAKLSVSTQQIFGSIAAAGSVRNLVNRRGSIHSAIKSAAPAVSSCCLTELIEYFSSFRSASDIIAKLMGGWCDCSFADCLICVLYCSLCVRENDRWFGFQISQLKSNHKN